MYSCQHSHAFLKEYKRNSSRYFADFWWIPMTGEFSSRTSHTCARAWDDGVRRWYINDKRRFTRIVHPYTCALIVVESVGRIRRSESCRRVRRISILAWSSVCSDIWSISIWRTWRVYGSHLLPPHPCRPPTPPTSYPRARLCHPRVMDTQGVGDYANEASRPYGWRFMGRPKGNVIVPMNVFLANFRPLFRRLIPMRFQCFEQSEYFCRSWRS